MERDVWFVANHPTIVRCRRDIEELPGPKFDDAPIVEGGGGAAAQHQTEMLHRTARGAYSGADVYRPSPAGLVGRASEGASGDGDDVEPAFGEATGLVRLIETPQDDVEPRRRYGPRHAGTASFPAPSAGGALPTNIAPTRPGTLSLTAISLWLERQGGTATRGPPGLV